MVLEEYLLHFTAEKNNLPVKFLLTFIYFFNINKCNPKYIQKNIKNIYLNKGELALDLIFI